MVVGGGGVVVGVGGGVVVGGGVAVGVGVGSGPVPVPAFSAAQCANQAIAEFQLIATSLTEYAPMSSMKHFCGLQPASWACATGSCKPLFGPPDERAGRRGAAANASCWWAQNRWCRLRDAARRRSRRRRTG